MTKGFGIFPSFYEDELVYSLFARCHIVFGNILYVDTIRDLFGEESIKPEIEFINSIMPMTRDYLTRNISMEDIILNHTMFSQYARFQSKERRKAFFNSLMETKEGYYDIININSKGEDAMLRYCPICVKEDREKYGETYWHRKHQLRGLNICPIHFCKLHKSEVGIIKEKVRCFISCESVAKETSIIMCENEVEKSLAKYVYDTFMMPIDLDNSIKAKAFLDTKLYGTKYLCATGQKRNLSLLWEDISSYYKDVDVELGINFKWQLGRIFHCDKNDLFSICQMGMFLGVSPLEFVEMKLPLKSQYDSFLEEVHALKNQGVGYLDISKRMGVDVTTIRSILGVRKNHSRHYQCKNKSSRCKYDYDALDKELLPKVQEIVQDSFCSGEKPKRITFRRIENILGLKSKVLDKLSLCREYILSHMESIEAFWIREIIWSMEEVKKQGKVLCVTRIMNLTHLNKRKICCCVAQMDEGSLKSELEAIL